MINQQLKRLKKIFLPFSVSGHQASLSNVVSYLFSFYNLNLCNDSKPAIIYPISPTIKWKEIYKTIVGWTSEMAGLIHPGKQTFVIPLINPKKEFKIKK